MFHKIRNVISLDNFQLGVQFTEGDTKIYDIKPLIYASTPFAYFSDHPEAFTDVHVDTGGYGVVWNDDIDLECEEIWEKGEIVQTPFSGLMSFGEATELWNLNESTLRKAVSYGKLAEGVDVCKFGKQWVVTQDAMIREYGVPK